MDNPIYNPLRFSNKWPDRLHDPFWPKKKARSKASSDRALEQKKKKKKKSCVEGGFNAEDREYEEGTTADVIIPMDTDGLIIDPYTKVIPPDMVLTYASDDDSNIESNSNSEYEPEDDNDNVLGVKKNLRAVLLFTMPLRKQIYICCETGTN